MDLTHISPVQESTFFAPAERSSPAKLEEQCAGYLADDLADALMQAMPGYAMLINQQRQIVAVNSSLLRITGFHSSGALIGKRPGEALNCIHAGDAPGGCGTGRHCSVCGAVLAIIESQESGRQAVRECHVTLSGDEEAVLDMQATATPVQIRGEKFTVFVLQDISSEKRREVLERVFFHDVINTAGSIHGLASILVEQGGVPAHLETEYKNWLVRLSGTLVDEVRSQRKLLAAENGEFLPEVTSVDIRSILSEIYQLYHQYDKTPGRNLVILDGGNYTVRSDASVILRIIGNMTINALEATPIGGVVTISARAEGPVVVIEVHNDLVMAEDTKLQIFKRSFSTKSTAGRGIGTYSMKLFGERYLKGRVTFRSSLEEGTVFSFSLPIDQ
ncbi:MAG: histidine kinase [Geobacteraceae bacterium]|nr:histidine kinase [Geobacteraceae bacterium]